MSFNDAIKSLYAPQHKGNGVQQTYMLRITNNLTKMVYEITVRHCPDQRAAFCEALERLMDKALPKGEG